MKIKLRDIKPNPFRYINKGYPIDQVKVEKLRSSIKRTGFWDNLVARNKDGEIQIAYGHHRIEACKLELGKDFEVDLIIKDLDDAAMLKIMAAENDNLHLMSPAVINETIRAAVSFLKDDIKMWEGLSKIMSSTHKSDSFTPQQLEYMQRSRDNDCSLREQVIGDFLDWPRHRITEALASIKAIENHKIDKEEYESIPNQKAAEQFRREITKQPLSKSDRSILLDKIRKNEIGTQQIRSEILRIKFPNGKNQKRDINLEDVADTISMKLKEASVLITDNFVKNADALSGEATSNLEGSVRMLYGKLMKLKRIGVKQLGR